MGQDLIMIPIFIFAAVMVLGIAMAGSDFD